MKKERYVKVTEWDLQCFYDTWALEGKPRGKWEIFMLPFSLLIASTLAIIIYPYYIYKGIKKYRNTHWEKSSQNTRSKSQ